MLFLLFAYFPGSFDGFIEGQPGTTCPGNLN
jgi:hypothetical protein